MDFCYSLQLRGLAAGGVTAWSEVSEGMSTESTTTYRERKSTYSGEEMLRRDPVDQAKTLKNEKTRFFGFECVEELSKKLEQILRCTLLHAVHGVKLPTMHILSSGERVRQMRGSFTDRWCPHVMADRVVNRTEGFFGDGGLGLDTVDFMVSKKKKTAASHFVQSFPSLSQGFRAEPWFNVSGKDLFFSAHVDEVRVHSAALKVHNSGLTMTEPSRGYLGLQVQRFCAHSAWSLRSDGREHGGRGFRAGRTGLSAARMAKFKKIGTGACGYRPRRSCCLGS